MNQPRTHRPIRSFVLREGRLTKGQQRAMDELFPRWGVEFAPDTQGISRSFERDADLVLEVGFGMGQSLVAQAAMHPERNYLGVEVHRPGVGACLLRAEEQGVSNLRVIRHDAVEVLREMVADGSLSRIQIYFPDPWHKARHHKRRIVQPEFIALCSRKLKTGGILHLATDWENYAEHMLEVLNGESSLNNLSATGDYVPRPDERPITKFETRGQKLGHGVWDLLFQKAGASADKTSGV